ncbi:MAG: N-acetylneuraminate synthase family protein [Nanoarchaeota archaeon]|nr:N-acetylneuraminate synthase family protein [Nanoarchaeota archaeon]
MKKIKIDNKYLGGNEAPFVIAEIGINHQGDVKIAKQLIDMAHYAGADAVKFQKRTTDKILTREGLDKPYLNANSFGLTYGKHREKLELKEEDYFELKKYAKEKDLVFLASGWDEQSIEFLDELKVPAFKIPSADLTNLPLLKYTAKKQKPIILSTGMSTMDEVKEAVKIVSEYNKDIILMQCTSTYPCDFKDLNLNVLKTYEKIFGEKVVLGYSGHELGVTAPLIAYMLGARVFERHFTLDRTMKGGDHAASLEPDSFKRLVRDLKRIPVMLGGFEKKLLENEKPIREKLAKSLVANKYIPKGATITQDMLCAKSPGNGLSPKYYDLAVGGVALKDIAEDNTIFKEDIKLLKK